MPHLDIDNIHTRNNGLIQHTYDYRRTLGSRWAVARRWLRTHPTLCYLTIVSPLSVRPCARVPHTLRLRVTKCVCVFVSGGVLGGRIRSLPKSDTVTVNAIKWGRNVYGCIQKFLQFQLTVRTHTHKLTSHTNSTHEIVYKYHDEASLSLSALV